MGPLFYGRYYISLDDKGRIKIPSQFKRSLDLEDVSILVLTNFGDCVRGYPYKVWKELITRSQQLPAVQENKLASDRLFFSSVNMVKIDGQGRLLIPNSLRMEVGLNEHLVLLGINHRFEIWDKALWDNYQKVLSERKEKIFEELTNAGF